MSFFATFFNSIVFYLNFREKLSCSNLLGMAFYIGCLICVSVFSAKNKGEIVVNDEGVEQSQSVYQFYALGVAFLVPIGHSISAFVIRKFKGSY